MARIYIGGAGGAPSNNFIRSLKESNRKDYLIGSSCVPTDLFLADTEERYVVPPATDQNYASALSTVISASRPDFLHIQNDYEVQAVSNLRKEIMEKNVQLYLPKKETVDICIDKQSSYECWRNAGVKVPETFSIGDKNDLRNAFDRLGGKLWIRATVGAAGRGALPTDDYEFARLWIDKYDGWGEFTAAEMLTEKTVTWLSIWYHGELVVAQTRKRLSWNFGNRTLSGVTGITGVGETCTSELVNQVAQDSILAIDSQPHGIFGVDMAYDHDGIPNPTEINIGRFFTTHYFFTKAGLNLPEIYCNIGLDNNFPSLTRKINPLPDGLIWIRGMDVEPVLTTRDELAILCEKTP